jgi:hypothetical protein
MSRGWWDGAGADMSDARQAAGAVIHVFEVGDHLWGNEVPAHGSDDNKKRGGGSKSMLNTSSGCCKTFRAFQVRQQQN